MKNRSLSCLTACAILFISISNAADAPGSFLITEMEQAIVDLTNQERKKSGLAELKMNQQLFDAARLHAENMAKQKKLEHKLDGKSHSDRMTEAGYKWMSARENIAWNQRSAREVVDGWMNSEGHRVNIQAKEVTEIGVAAVADSKGQIYFAQLFGLPQSAAVNLKFTIQNLSRQTITVDMGTPKTSKLEPNEKTRYTLTTADSPVLVTLKAEGLEDITFQLENGGIYRIGKDGTKFIFVTGTK